MQTNKYKQKHITLLKEGTTTMASPESAPRSPEAAPKKGNEVFSPADIDELREKQKKLIIEATKDIDPYDTEARKAAKQAVYDTFDRRVKQYLIAEGVAEGDDDPKLKKAAEYLRGYSIDKTSDDDWLYSGPDKDGTLQLSGRETVRQDYEELARSSEKEPEVEPAPIDVSPTPEVDPTPVDPTESEEEDEPKPTDEENPTDEPKKEDDPTDEEKEKKVKERLEKIAELEKTLEGVQAAKHAAYAARMNVSVFRPGKKKKLQGEYEAAEEAYAKAVNELERLRIEHRTEELKESGAMVDRGEVAREELLGRLQARLLDDDKRQRAAMIENGGLKAKALEKYSKMSKAKKIAVMITAGAALAAVGFAAGVAGGIVGAAGAAVAGGAVMAGRFARTYTMAQAQLYEAKDKESLQLGISEADSKSSDDILRLGIARLKYESESDIDKADKVKKRAVYFGLGAVALGSTAGIVASHLSDSWLGVSDTVPGYAGGKVGDLIADSGDVAAAAPVPELDPAHTWNGEMDGVGEKSTEPVMEFSPESTILNPGDGGYRIMERMGIPQEHWHDVWQKVGPELASIETNSGTPFGYQMSGQYSGEWGVRMTPDGKVPDEALKLIAQTHEDMYGNLPSSVEMTQAEGVTKEVAPTPLEVTPEQTQALEQVIKSGETISPATIAEHSIAFEGWQDVARGMTGEAFADSMGMPMAVWNESVTPFIEEQLQAGNRMYTNTFSLVGDQIQLQVNRIPDQVMADMLNQVPALTRSSFTLAA